MLANPVLSDLPTAIIAHLSIILGYDLESVVFAGGEYSRQNASFKDGSCRIPVVCGLFEGVVPFLYQNTLTE
jgi:hypothetical protein